LAIRCCKETGYRGQMLAVHPKKGELEGVPGVPRIADLAFGPDAAFTSIPADAGRCPGTGAARDPRW
jgi:acyl-CoA synthetase (NDP forming)